MRIEFNAGGLSGLISIATFGTDYNNLIGKSRNVITSFKTVKQKTVSMSGGVGNLQGAVDQIDRRIKTEEAKVEKMEAVGKRFADFLVNTVKTDKRVANMVRQNKEEFYKVNPWARPPVPPFKETDGFGKAMAWLFQKGKDLVGDFKKGIDTVKDVLSDTTSKCWNGIKNFCVEHAQAIKKIVVGLAVIAVVGVLSVVTGGTAAVIFGAAFKGAVVGALSKAAIKGVTGGVKYIGENGENTTAGGLFGAMFDSAATGFMEGSISGALEGGASVVGPLAVLGGSTNPIKMQKMAKGFAKGIGDAANYTIGNLIDKKEIKLTTVLTNFGIGFATGYISEGIDIKSKLPTKEGAWVKGTDFAKAGIKKEMEKSLSETLNKKLKDGFISNLPVLAGSSYKLPKSLSPDAIMKATVENVSSFIKDKATGENKNVLISFPAIANMTKFGFTSGLSGFLIHGSRIRPEFYITKPPERRLLVTATNGGGSW